MSPVQQALIEHLLQSLVRQKGTKPSLGLEEELVRRGEQGFSAQWPFSRLARKGLWG